MTTLSAYGDDELAALYDLVYDGYDADLPLYEQFARGATGPILELGAGSGRVASHLARAGFDVVALDSSSHMLARIRRGLPAAASARVRTIEADMRDFELPGERFLFIYCAFFTFEHLLTPADQAAALRSVARHLAPGGRFVMQLRSLTAVDWSLEDSPLIHDWTRLDPATGEPVTKLRAGTVARARQLTTDTLIFERTKPDAQVHRRTLEVTLRVSSRYEIEAALAAAGLRMLALYGDTDLSPFDDRSDTMVVVAGLEGTTDC